VKSLAEVRINHLGLRRRDIDADLPHRHYRVWVQDARVAAGADDLECIARQVAKKRLSHLGAAGILSAKKQNFSFARHSIAPALLAG
jgi:hypothetical protein